MLHKLKDWIIELFTEEDEKNNIKEKVDISQPDFKNDVGISKGDNTCCNEKKENGESCCN